MKNLYLMLGPLPLRARLTIFAIICSGLLGCAPAERSGIPREFSANSLQRPPALVGINAASVWPDLQSARACGQLESLAQERSHPRSRFAFLATPFTFEINSSGSIRAIGSVDLIHSPLIQFVLTTPAVQRRVEEVLSLSDERFLELARERLDVENCEREEPKSERCTENLRSWRGALGKFQEGLLHQEKPNAIARELRARFAGVFGNADDMELGKENSVFLNVLDRAGLFRGGIATVAPIDAEAILTAEVPLFPYDRNWASWLADTRAALPAAMNGMNSPEGAERLCAVVLWQRMFAQLLQIKGYEAPRLNSEGRLPALGPEARGIETVETPGAYITQTAARRVSLHPEEIPVYDPTKLDAVELALNRLTPLPRDRETPAHATLAATLDQLEALIWIYAATSPAAQWAEQNTYYFGDLVESEHAVVPFQSHTLALGLALMTLRNLGHRYILPVDFQNDLPLAAGGNGTAMHLLSSSIHNLEQAEQGLYELARLALALVRWEEAILRIQAMNRVNPAELARRSMVFDKEAGKEGPFYTPEKVADFDNLLAIIRRLKYPLAHRLHRMANTDECQGRQILGLNSTSLILHSRQECTAAEREIFREAMLALGHSAGSTIFLRHAEALTSP